MNIETLVKGNLIIWGALVVMLSLTACSSQTGWTLSVGLNPVSYVNNQQGLAGGVKSNGGAILNAKDERRY